MRRKRDQQPQLAQQPYAASYAQQPYPQPYAPAYAVATAEAAAPARRHRGLIGDLFRGAFLGDFAVDLGLAGAIVQIVCGFMPVIGDLCALRDCLADFLRRDWIGLGLNILALIPIAGGFPKTIEVLRTLSHLGHMGHIAHRRTHENDGQHPAPRHA